MHHYRVLKFQVKNFRNLTAEITEFGPKINCLFGENGNGKTNVLEALYVLGQRKSFRKNSSFPQMLSTDGEKCEIYFSALLQSPQKKDAFALSVKWAEKSFLTYRENLLQKKRIDIPFVFLGPFDAHLFYQTPKYRRDWFDHHLGMVVANYSVLLSQYNKLLRFRNELLSRRPCDFLQQIVAIDRKLAEVIPVLTMMRRQFLEDISPFYPEIFRKIFAEELALSLVLQTEIREVTNDFIFNWLQSGLSLDLARSHTIRGVHRDDYELLLNGLPVLEFASVGQQKIIYFSLLFAYLEFFRYKWGFYPIVLIDDMSSELDNNRWERLISFLDDRDFQIFITTANEHLKEKLECLKDVRSYQITAGKITRL